MNILNIVVANLDFNRPGDDAYISYLENWLGPEGVLLLQEKDKGQKSTRVKAKGLKVKPLSRLLIGTIGAHRGVARGKVKINGKNVRIFSAHALHVKTSGRAAQSKYFKLLSKFTKKMNVFGGYWIIGGDFNRPIHEVADILGGKAYGHGIEGIIVSKKVKVIRQSSDATGIKKKWTDHEARKFSVTV